MAKSTKDETQPAAAAAAARAKQVVDWAEIVQAGLGSLAKDWWEPEHAPGGEWFVWGGAAAEVSLPPLPRGTRLELDLMPHRGASPLDIVLNGKRLHRVEGNAQRQRYWLGEEGLLADARNRLQLSREQGYVPSDRDLRPLAVQLFGVRSVGAGVTWAGAVAAEEERARSLVKATGVLDPEEFPEGRGVWTKPEAKLVVPAGPGKLTITLWAPRPKPPLLEISARGTRLVGPLEVGHEPIRVEVPLSAAEVARGAVELDLKATPFCPAKEGVSSDARELGVVLSHLRFTPAHA